MKTQKSSEVYENWLLEEEMLSSGFDERTISEYFHVFAGNFRSCKDWFFAGFKDAFVVKELLLKMSLQEALEIKERYMDLGMDERTAERWLSFYPKLGDLSQQYLDGWKEPERFNFVYPLKDSFYREINELVNSFLHEGTTKEAIWNFFDAYQVITYRFINGTTTGEIDYKKVRNLKGLQEQTGIFDLNLMDMVKEDFDKLKRAKERVSFYMGLGFSQGLAESWTRYELEHGIELTQKQVKTALAVGIKDGRSAIDWFKNFSVQELSQLYVPEVNPYDVKRFSKFGKVDVSALKRATQLGVSLWNSHVYFLFSKHKDIFHQISMPYQERFRWLEEEGEKVQEYVSLGIRNRGLKDYLEKGGYTLDVLKDLTRNFPMEFILEHALLKGLNAQDFVKEQFQKIQNRVVKSFGSAVRRRKP